MTATPCSSRFCARDFVTFVEKCFETLEPGATYEDNWHVHAIAHQLVRVWRGESTRLIINIPPRMMKSIMVTIAFSAWVMGHDPRKRIMAVSYAKALAGKHASDFRAIVESPWFRAAFPDFMIETNRGMEIATTARGYRVAESIGGSLLGRGADLIIIDDPIKGLAAALSESERRRVAEFYDNTLYSRLNNKAEGAIVIVMQRLHQDDLVGHVLEKEDWEVLSIPAIATEDTTYRLGPAPSDIYERRAGDVLHPARENRARLEPHPAQPGLPQLLRPVPAEPAAGRRQCDKAGVDPLVRGEARRLRLHRGLVGHRLDDRGGIGLVGGDGLGGCRAGVLPA